MQIELISRACSVSAKRVYGKVRVCRLWEVARSTHYAQQAAKTTMASTRRGRIVNRVGLKERPPVVDGCRHFGDWDGNTVLARGRRAGHVVGALPHWRPAVKSTTVDNGNEFATHERVSAKLACPVYFVRPNHSWERGSNEDTNGLVPKYSPTGTDFAQVSEEGIEEVEDKLCGGQLNPCRTPL